MNFNFENFQKIDVKKSISYQLKESYCLLMEIYITEQSLFSEDFIGSCLMDFGEGEWAEDYDELCEITFSIEIQKEILDKQALNKLTHNKIVKLIDDLDEDVEVGYLFKKWNRKALYFRLMSKVVFVCISIPE